jgi:hypothetical protein
MMPDRLAPEFAATVKATVPLPVPAAPEVIVIHDAAAAAVHAHPLAAITVKVPVPPAAGTVAPPEFSVYVQLGSAAAWLTVNVRPAMAIVLERAAPRFGSTRYPTVPFPFPLVPVLNEIHDALFEAVHAHPASTATTMEPVPPIADTEALVGSILYVQVGAGAACVTVKVRVAIVTVPVRAAPVLAAIVIPTEPLPLPFAPEVIVIHGALLTAAVQVQPAGAVTVTGLIAPPVAPTSRRAAPISYVHVGAAGAACVTVNDRPAIATVPDRTAPVLAAIVIATEPLPLPLAPDVIAIHGALLTAAVQVQPAVAVTVTGLIAPPLAATSRPAGLIS